MKKIFIFIIFIFSLFILSGCSSVPAAYEENLERNVKYIYSNILLEETFELTDDLMIILWTDGDVTKGIYIIPYGCRSLGGDYSETIEVFIDLSYKCDLPFKASGAVTNEELILDAVNDIYYNKSNLKKNELLKKYTQFEDIFYVKKGSVNYK